MNITRKIRIQTVAIPERLLREIARWAEENYPYEGCGILLGQFRPLKRAERFVSLPNLLRGKRTAEGERAIDKASETLGIRAQSSGAFEFVMDPKAFHQAALSAEKEDLDVVGIVHTHPDHPARPSAVDERQPLLSMWSNVIVSVNQKKFFEARSWIRENENDPFEEETLSVIK